jgi:3-hydroxyisobutyrate dehydrogenase-like beta-hydroxyacid dehydrogenase
MTGASETIGWIGLGIMGEAMCTRLVKAGHKVVVWNRTQSKVRRYGYLFAQPNVGAPRR